MDADFRAFVDALQLDRFSLVAHSMGANVAWLFAARTPERVERLVIEDTAPPTPATFQSKSTGSGGCGGGSG